MMCVIGIRSVRAFDLGICIGVQSYPAALDPGDFITRTPAVYPRVEVSAVITGKWIVHVGFMRGVYESDVFQCYCIQSMELNVLPCGVAYCPRSGKSGFRIGIDALPGFSCYDHGGVLYNSTTLGVKLYFAVQQPINQSISYAFRTGVQRQPARASESLSINMDSFVVEVCVFMSL
jgi:hypothetical protein